MANAKKIRVMISSRCNDQFPEGGQTLSKLREQLKQRIESEALFGRKLFEVWMNEDTPPQDAGNDSWESCLKAVKDCDVLIVISNGNAGWAKAGGDIGICHAEYMTGLEYARGKVYLISLPDVKIEKRDQGPRHARFKDYLNQQTAFRGGEVSSVEDLNKRVFEALAESIVTLSQRGVSASSSVRFDLGEALNWTRLDFRTRKREMERVLLDSLGSQPGAKTVEGAAIVIIAGANVAMIPHAIPASFSVASARELVGRPFLNDHARIDLLSKAAGPIHVIACHRGATETQATSLLGFPDATVVSGPFGVFVADDIQKVQFVFLANCRDSSQTRHAAQRFIEWLSQAGETEMLAKRAESRSRIVKAIAKENTH